MQDLSKDVTYEGYEGGLGDNTTNSLEDASTTPFSNYSAMAQRSDFETSHGDRKFPILFQLALDSL